MRFQFRLEKVLEYRRSQEDEAKQKFLTLRASRIRGEAEISAIGLRRKQMLAHPVKGLTGFTELQMRMIRLDDEERFTRTALTVMVNEEEAAERAWLLRRQELRSIELLREKSFAEWSYEQERSEQAALDEWAVMRR